MLPPVLRTLSLFFASCWKGIQEASWCVMHYLCKIIVPPHRMLKHNKKWMYEEKHSWERLASLSEINCPGLRNKVMCYLHENNATVLVSAEESFFLSGQTKCISMISRLPPSKLANFRLFFHHLSLLTNHIYRRESKKG